MIRVFSFVTILFGIIDFSASQCFLTPPICPNPNVTFFLYTRDTQQNPVQLDVSQLETINEANFVKNRPLIVLIHGFKAHKDESPNKQIRPAYFARDEFNIISVHYHPLALENCYLTAVNNLPTVANCTAQLLDNLISNNIIALEAIHVVREFSKALKLVTRLILQDWLLVGSAHCRNGCQLLEARTKAQTNHWT